MATAVRAAADAAATAQAGNNAVTNAPKTSSAPKGRAGTPSSLQSVNDEGSEFSFVAVPGKEQEKAAAAGLFRPVLSAPQAVKPPAGPGPESRAAPLNAPLGSPPVEPVTNPDAPDDERAVSFSVFATTIRDLQRTNQSMAEQFGKVSLLLVAQMEGLRKQLAESQDTNLALAEEVRSLRTKVAALEKRRTRVVHSCECDDEVDELSRRVKNVRDMTPLDRLFAFIDPAHTEKVLSRGGQNVANAGR